MRVIVTGGAGFVGAHLVDALVRRGDEVLVIDRNLGTFQNPEADYWQVDIRELQLGDNSIRVEPAYVDRNGSRVRLKWPLESADCIFHLAAVSRVGLSFDIPHDTYTTNVIGTLNVCNLAARAECRLIYAGSSTGRPGEGEVVHDSPYAYSKAIGEQLVLNYARGMVCRLFNVYGPRNNTLSPYDSVVTVFERQYLKLEAPTIVGDGEQRRDFIHVADVVSGLLGAANGGYPGMLVELGSQVDFSVNDVATLFGFDLKSSRLITRDGERRRTRAESRNWGWIGFKPTITLQSYVRDVREKLDRRAVFGP